MSMRPDILPKLSLATVLALFNAGCDVAPARALNPNLPPSSPAVTVFQGRESGSTQSARPHWNVSPDLYAHFGISPDAPDLQETFNRTFSQGILAGPMKALHTQFKEKASNMEVTVWGSKSADGVAFTVSRKVGDKTIYYVYLAAYPGVYVRLPEGTELDEESISKFIKTERLTDEVHVPFFRNPGGTIDYRTGVWVEDVVPDENIFQANNLITTQLGRIKDLIIEHISTGVKDPQYSLRRVVNADGLIGVLEETDAHGNTIYFAVPAKGNIYQLKVNNPTPKSP